MHTGETTTHDEIKDELIVDELCGLFPTFPRTELKKRLESCNDVDTLIDTIFREIEGNQQENDMGNNNERTSLSLLKDIFPDKLNHELTSALERCNDNVEMATYFLLEGNKEQTEERNKSLTAEELPSILNLSSTIIRPYLSRNAYDPLRTILDVIFNYKLTNVSKANLPSGGKVQGRSTRPISSLGSYTIDENSWEFKELKSIYVSNPMFSTMNDNFFEKGLEFFKGNIAKVIEVATIVLDHDAADLTHEFSPKTQPKLLLSEILKPSVNRSPLIKKPASQLSQGKSFAQSISNSNLSTFSKKVPRASQETLIGQRYQKLDISGKVDLHGLIVSDSLFVVKNALDSWWSQEVNERLNHGRLDQFGSTAVFVEPLHIITGRGLHSVDGVSKVKKAVVNYLHRCSYTFEEYPGSLDVIGKKKPHK